MAKFGCVPGSRPVSFVFFLAFAIAAAWAQQGPPAAPSAGASAAQSAAGEPDNTSSESKANDDLLAKAAKLYYSTKEAGLEGFDCEVHPDWRKLFSSATQGAVIADDDRRLLTLKPVKITMHARMGGGSSVDWVQTADPGKPLDADATSLLEQMHRATEQTVMGFLQFWTPFVDGSVVPASSTGMKVTHSATDYTIHIEQNGAQVTEIFSNEWVLQHFDVVTSGASIKFAPSYQPTEKGLLVNRFEANIDPVGQATGPAQQMHVQVSYATVDGLPIPSNLNMEVVGTGVFNLSMDACRTHWTAKQ
jgi:hypothetical protein